MQPGSNVQLEFIGETGKKLIYRTTISEYAGEQLSLLVPKNDWALQNIKPDTKITLIYHSDLENRDYSIKAQFIKAEAGKLFLVINKSAEMKFSIGRHLFRCEVNLPFEGFLKKEKFKGEVTNLSATGLYVVVSPTMHFEKGDVITGKIVLPTANEPVLFVGTVVRIIIKENFQGIGLKFQHVTKQLQDPITKYLFQRQRALMNLGQIRIVKSE